MNLRRIDQRLLSALCNVQCFTRSHASVSVLVIVMALFFSCKKNDHTPDKPPGNSSVEVLSFTPASGVAGTEVTITGRNFDTTKTRNHVFFNGAITEAEVTGATATELKVKVPFTTSTGKFIVEVDNSKDTSATVFTILTKELSITGFTPAQGPFGTSVTLTGNKFGNNVKILLNGITAPITNKSPDKIEFTIPVNTSLTKHKITLVSDGDTLQTTDEFTITGGPYARWEYKNVSFVSDGAEVFISGLSFVYKNKIYWGFTHMSFLDDWADYVVFDPARPADGWQLQNRLPATVIPDDLQQAAVVSHNNRVFIGTGLSGGARKDWWEYFPETNTGTKLTDYPEVTAGAVPFVLNNTIYVGFGGVSKKLHTFNPAGNNNAGSWAQVATGNFRELNSSSAFVLGNDVYIGRVLQDLNQVRKAFYKFTAPDQLTRVTDIPEELPFTMTPSFTIGNKGYFVVSKKVWEYTPDASGGTWRAVIGVDSGPSIIKTAVVTVNGTSVVYGWTGSGKLYEFTFN